MSEKQTDPGRKSLVIGVSVLAASIFCTLVLFNFLASMSSDAWAPFILIFYGFAGIVLIVSLVGLSNGIGQVVSQRKKEEKPAKAAIAGIVLNSLVITLPLIILILSWGTTHIATHIEPNERGLVLSLNEPTGEVLEPGYHFVIPNKQVVIYNISRQTYTASANFKGEADFIEGTTKDGQKIQVDISVFYAVDPGQLPDLYKTWGDTYGDSVVRPMSRSITRNTLGKYTYDEIDKNRGEISQIISSELENILSENFLILVDFIFRDIRLAP